MTKFKHDILVRIVRTLDAIMITVALYDVLVFVLCTKDKQSILFKRQFSGCCIVLYFVYCFCKAV